MHTQRRRPDLAARNKARALHGMTNTPTFVTWSQMLGRCHSEAHKDYPNYGARGITVCNRWRASFLAFLADMGERPAGMTIDRIDNNGHYEPGNCRWAAPKTQARNRRSNTLIEWNGKSRPIADWADELGINRKALEMRLRSMPVDEALSRPYTPRTKRAA